jgi:hypothetical protein
MNGDEITRLQTSRDEWAARAVFAITAPTLTATERGAVERAAAWMARAAESRGELHSAGYLCADAAVLRSMLERLK